eukprot:Gb_01730 [translate_table: standard]
MSVDAISIPTVSDLAPPNLTFIDCVSASDLSILRSPDLSYSFDP